MQAGVILRWAAVVMHNLTWISLSRVSLPTSEMLTSIEMGRRADGRIVIESVAPDSDMAQVQQTH